MELARKYQMETLLFCPHPWALRHRFINKDTGETIRARCNRWECLYCGPRKVDMWRRLIKEAQPTLHVVLTKVGWTVQEASRTYTTVLQYLRRGSKGRGRGRLDVREAYPMECFSVLEEHKNFQRVGFHWHILVKGVDFLPQPVVREALRSATEGRSYIAHVRKVKNQRAVGYVTKYLTKEVTVERRGVKQEQRQEATSVLDAVEGVQDERGSSYLYVVRHDRQGQPLVERVTQTVEQMSRARRIRYTHYFFPESTSALRARLFSDLGNGEIALDGPEGPDVDESEDEGRAPARSSWVLYEHDPFSSNIQDYRDRRQSALEESLLHLRDGKQLYSRRVVSVWDYQRKLQRQQRRLMASHTESEVQ